MTGADGSGRACWARARGAGTADRGSVLPLVLGMVVCVLLLGAGVTAATSVFLARANLQHVCDGAASAAAEAAERNAATSILGASSTLAEDAAVQYLAPRAAGTRVAAALDGEWTRLACAADAPVAFGGLFGSPTVEIAVDSVGHAGLRQEDS